MTKEQFYEGLRRYIQPTRYEDCDFDDWCVAEIDAQDQRIAALESALSRTIKFIEYARYELEPGLATIGSQFPKQEDADKIMKEAAEALNEGKK